MKLLQYKHIEGSTYGFLSFFGRKLSIPESCIQKQYSEIRKTFSYS